MGIQSLTRIYIKPETYGIEFETANELLEDYKSSVYVYRAQGKTFVTNSGMVSGEEKSGYFPLEAFDEAHDTVNLGAVDFLRDHNLKYPYVAGGMTQAIASIDMVVALGREGFMGFYGTGGLSPSHVENAVADIQQKLAGGETYGINMISLSPQDDQRMVDIFLKHKVRRIEVAGAIALTPAVVEYRLKGLRRDGSGRLIADNHIFAKVSREEVAALFMSPPPERIVNQLLESGKITHEQAMLAKEIPVAADIIAEADSGGHTDGRPALLLYQNMVILRDQIVEQYKYKDIRIRIGAAGGICTPSTVLAAFTLGGDFVMTGSVNQACVEAGTSEQVKHMLSQCSMSDVAIAPSADMFEMGSKVQVMTRGMMFHLKANKLYEVYQNYKSIDEIPEKIRTQLEEKTFNNTLENVWEGTKKFFMERSPEVIQRAEKNPKFKMALIFRSYLGLSSKWAQKGEMDKKVDFQIFCGPGMGAFNRWTKGTYLETPENRHVADVAKNLVHGAMYLKRLNYLKEQGVEINPGLMRVLPKKRIYEGQ